MRGTACSSEWGHVQQRGGSRDAGAGLCMWHDMFVFTCAAVQHSVCRSVVCGVCIACADVAVCPPAALAAVLRVGHSREDDFCTIIHTVGDGCYCFGVVVYGPPAGADCGPKNSFREMLLRDKASWLVRQKQLA